MNYVCLRYSSDCLDGSDEDPKFCSEFIDDDKLILNLLRFQTLSVLDSTCGSESAQCLNSTFSMGCVPSSSFCDGNQ